MFFNNINGVFYSEIGFPAVFINLVAYSLLRHLEMGAYRLHVIFEFLVIV